MEYAVHTPIGGGYSGIKQPYNLQK